MASDMGKLFAVVFSLILLTQFSVLANANEDNNQINECNLQFNGENANESVHYQTSLGPRLPGSEASSKLRESIKSNLTDWRIVETTHHVDGMVLTNLFATWNHGLGSEVILAAHYDTRDRAEKDPDENRTMEPILGANDGASGVAVLIELARIIPSMDLDHEVTLFFTDGEDQGIQPSFLGAKAWSENLSDEEAESIESFILVDMVGDANLTITKTVPGDVELWNRTEMAIDDISEICEDFSTEFYDNSSINGVGDDHIYAIQKGIPAIDIIDVRYGPNATAFGGYWHTHEDTDDKVSSESLQTIGRIVEYGLEQGYWLNIRENPEPENNSIDSYEVDDDASVVVENTSVGFIFIAMIIVIWANLLYLIYADTEGEG
jgi:glutaminyl-peptide cyclotransferase